MYAFGSSATSDNIFHKIKSEVGNKVRQNYIYLWCLPLETVRSVNCESKKFKLLVRVELKAKNYVVLTYVEVYHVIAIRFLFGQFTTTIGL